MIKELGSRISTVISTVSLGASILAGLAVIFVATSVVVEVISRGIFNHPLIDLVTIGRIGMGVVGLLAAAYALRLGKHVNIGFIVNYLPKRIGKIVNLVGMIISFFCLVFLVWGAFKLARFSQVHDIAFEGGLYTFPVYLPQMLVPLGLGLFAFELLVIIIKIMADLKNDG